MKELTKEFQNIKVKFKLDENGQSMVDIESIARFCGWTKIANSGNEVIRCSRVNGYLKELGVPTCGHDNYIPEFIMYALIGKAKNEKATKFMLWVGQTLVELRTKGVVILESATKEAIDFEKKYGKYRIRKTFTNSLDIDKDYKEFIELAKVENKQGRLNNLERVKLCNIIVSAIENKINTDLLEMKPSQIIGFQEVISGIKTDIVKLSNKGNGGVKASQTKKIMELEEILETSIVVPQQWEYITCQVHGMSNNYLYKNVNGKTYKSDAYNCWINNFPIDEVPEKEHWECDFNKPIEIFINYVAKEDMDIRNLDKATIDMIFNRIYGVDDNIVDCVHSERVGTCNSFDEGSIGIFIRNLGE